MWSGVGWEESGHIRDVTLTDDVLCCIYYRFCCQTVKKYRCGLYFMEVQILSLRPARRGRKNAESVDVICIFRLFLFSFVNEVLLKKVRFVLSNCCQNYA